MMPIPCRIARRSHNADADQCAARFVFGKIFPEAPVEQSMNVEWEPLPARSPENAPKPRFRRSDRRTKRLSGSVAHTDARSTARYIFPEQVADTVPEISETEVSRGIDCRAGKPRDQAQLPAPTRWNGTCSPGTRTTPVQSVAGQPNAEKAWNGITEHGRSVNEAIRMLHIASETTGVFGRTVTANDGQDNCGNARRTGSVG